MLLILSCGKRDTIATERSVALATEDKETNFDHRIHDEDEDLLRLAYLPSLRDSILHEFNKAAITQKAEAIRYPVCLTLEQKSLENRVQRFIEILEDAANRWNRVLVGEDGWLVAGIKLYMVGTRSTCPDLVDGLRVYKIKVSNATKRANAPYRDFIVNYPHSILTNPLPFTIIHEFGHQLGLADTYSEVGKYNPIGQPTSIMNNFHISGIMDLTRDDIDALKHLWRRLYKQNSQICPEGYRDTTNRDKRTYCVHTSGRDLLGLFDDSLSFEVKSVVSDVLSELNKSLSETEKIHGP